MSAAIPSDYTGWPVCGDLHSVATELRARQKPNVATDVTNGAQVLAGISVHSPHRRSGAGYQVDKFPTSVFGRA